MVTLYSRRSSPLAPVVAETFADPVASAPASVFVASGSRVKLDVAPEVETDRADRSALNALRRSNAEGCAAVVAANLPEMGSLTETSVPTSCISTGTRPGTWMVWVTVFGAVNAPPTVIDPVAVVIDASNEYASSFCIWSIASESCSGIAVDFDEEHAVDAVVIIRTTKRHEAIRPTEVGRIAPAMDGDSVTSAAGVTARTRFTAAPGTRMRAGIRIGI